MNYVMLIEQQGRQNAVKLDVTGEEPVIVGRSWQCDVVVIDQYVDAEHLKISANDDNQLAIEDLQSANGTRLQKKSIASTAEYKVGDEIVVGETTLRLINTDTEVQSAVRYENIVRLSQRMGNVSSVLIATAFAACMMFVVFYWGESSYVSRANFIEGYVKAFGSLLGWCFIGGVLSKLGRGKTFFTLHWTFMCALFAFIAAAKVIANFVHFNIGSAFLDSVSAHVLGAVTVAMLVYGTLTLISKLGRYKKATFTLCVVASFLFFDVVKPLLIPEHQKWTSYMNIRHTGQPPEFFVGTTESINTHFKKTSNLFEQLDISGNSASPIIVD